MQELVCRDENEQEEEAVGEEDVSKYNTNGTTILVTFPISMIACKTHLHIFSQTFIEGLLSAFLLRQN